MWGLITPKKSEFVEEVLGQPISVVVTDFKPFQAPDTDPKILEEARECFTLDEWLDVLINTDLLSLAKIMRLPYFMFSFLSSPHSYLKYTFEEIVH